MHDGIEEEENQENPGDAFLSFYLRNSLSHSHRRGESGNAIASASAIVPQMDACRSNGRLIPSSTFRSSAANAAAAREQRERRISIRFLRQRRYAFNRLHPLVQTEKRNRFRQTHATAHTIVNNAINCLDKGLNNRMSSIFMYA